MAAYPYILAYNFLAHRLMPGRHVFLIPEYTSKKTEEDAIEALKDVRFVIYRPEQSIHGRPSSLPENFMPMVHTYLMENYHQALKVRDILVLERNDPPSQGQPQQ